MVTTLNEQELSKLLLQLVEKSRDVFWVRSSDYSKQLYLSSVFEDIWGRKCEELYKHPEKWDEWLYPEDKITLYESLAKRNPQVHPNDIFYENYRIVRPDGQIRWIRDQSFPIIDEKGNLLSFMGIAQDVTMDRLRELELSEQKEKAEAANQIKTQLIRNLSHDIRTPLGGIIGMTELVSAQVNDDEIKQELYQMRQAGHLLLNLLNEIMTVAQMELGEIPDRQRRFSLLKIMQDVVNLFSPAATDKHLQLEMFYSEGLVDYMIGNDILVHQIVMNLVGNAIKFTHEGKISISAKLLEKTEKQLIVELSVEDTGIGIPEDKQEFIFAPFNRLTPSFENKYKGSGLGLYMVAEYIRHLNGEIHVESEMGKGSIFKCVLPFIRTLTENTKLQETAETPTRTRKEASKLLHPAATQPAVISEKKLDILLLEDDLLAQKMGTGFFTRLEHNVIVCANGMSAIQESHKKKFDLLILDLGLPDIGGCEVARIIRQDIHNPNQSTPMVALTAHADEQIRKECQGAGMQEVFDKPLTNDKALNMLAFVETDKELLVLDLNIAMQMMHNDEALMHQILDALIAELPERQNAMEIAFKSNNFSDLNHHVHKFYGAISYCGAPRLREAAKILEAALRAEEYEKVPEYYQKLIKEMGKFVSIYHQTVKKP